jgi:hypothetical protein
MVKPFTNYGSLESLTITGLADFDTTITPDVLDGTDAASTPARTAPNISTGANGNFISYCLQTNDRTQKIQWNSTTLIYDEGGPL